MWLILFSFFGNVGIFMKSTQSLKIHVRTLHPLLQLTSQSNEQDSNETRPNMGETLSRDKHDHYLD